MISIIVTEEFIRQIACIRRNIKFETRAEPQESRAIGEIMGQGSDTAVFACIVALAIGAFNIAVANAKYQECQVRIFYTF